jgi:hypothetical protein
LQERLEGTKAKKHEGNYSLEKYSMRGMSKRDAKADDKDTALILAH